MSNAILQLSEFEKKLVEAETPEETKRLEEIAAAARAYYDEQGDYEKTFDYACGYILARCKTTELIKPNIKLGGHNKQGITNDTLLADYGFTKLQFQRRRRERQAMKYFDAFKDDCIVTNNIPTPIGLVKFATMPNVRSRGKDAEPQEDKADELLLKWNVKPGQLWILGNHRLVCGNSQDPATLGLALDGEQPDLIITDPPYGMSLDTDYSKMPSTKTEGNKTYSPIANDDKPFDYGAVILHCLEEFWFGADYYHKTLPDGGSWLVWDKRVEDKFDAMIGSAFELIWCKAKHKREIIRHNNTLFSGSADAKDKLHPTVKPREVIDWIIGRHSKEDELIADLYAGTGTTIIASENMGCRCIAIEIEPKYVAVTLERWVTAFGIEPRLDN